MNRTILLFFAALLIISCTRIHQPIPGVPEIDVTLRFPEREINLADIVIDSRYFQFFEILNVDNWQRQHYVRDKQTGRIYRQNITLPDFQGRRFTIQPHPQISMQNGTYFQLCLQELKEAYEQNRLSGELKVLVSTLCEFEDNNVFAFIRFK